MPPGAPGLGFFSGDLQMQGIIYAPGEDGHPHSQRPHSEDFNLPGTDGPF
ncbi:MAG: hypothetical protein ACYCP0_02105 [Acidiferrobacteraceae bacterium]